MAAILPRGEELKEHGWERVKYFAAGQEGERQRGHANCISGGVGGKGNEMNPQSSTRFYYYCERQTGNKSTQCTWRQT